MACVRLQNLAQMHLAQDNDVVHTLTPDRSDQSFGKAVLPGRGWCGRLVPDAHGAQSACDDAAIDPIPIADEVTRSFIPRKCLRYLTCNPFCRRICRDVDPDQVSAVEPDDDEGIEQVETDSWNNEQVHGGNVRRVVTQEGSPSLAGRAPSFDHVRGDARLRDLKPELEQFAVNAWRAPKRIFDTHPPDQYAQLRVDNPLWGAPRIHGELLKLGFEVAQSSVAKYMVKRCGPPSPGWRTFLRSHAPDIAAIDLFIAPTIGFDLLYVLVIVRLERRKLVWM